MDYLNVEKITDEDEIGRIIHKHILNKFCSSYILVGEDRTCIPEYYLRFAEQIRNFEVKDDDIWVASYMKTGMLVHLKYKTNVNVKYLKP